MKADLTRVRAVPGRRGAALLRSIGQVLRGERIYDQLHASGHMLAYSGYEFLVAIGLASYALGFLADPGAGGISSVLFADALVGPRELWGLIAIAILAPQLAGAGMMLLGRKPHHEARVAFLAASAGYWVGLVFAWALVPSYAGVGTSAMGVGVAVFAARVVWRYNGPNARRFETDPRWKR